MTTGYRITDAQVHVWKESTPERPWPPAEIPPQRVPPLGVPELTERMAQAGVHRCLLVPPTWEGSRNDYVLAAAAAAPDRFGALCRVAAHDPADVERLAGWRQRTGMLGVRLSVNRGDTRQQLDRALASGFFATMERYGVPLSLYAPRLHTEIRDLAESFPALRITVDHLAVDSDEVPLRTAVEPLLPLAKLPNVAVKASALPCFVREPYPFPSITDTVYALV
ncbi:amidohydrolase family protein, partial [Phytohabitans sp. ZYX-F-186]